MSVINYDRPVKDLISGLNATGHVTHIAYRKTSVTFHHNGGRLSHQGVLNVWKTRPASAHFNVDAAGTVAQFVKVNEFAWSTGNRAGNQSSISIEMCNETVGGQWKVSPTTWKSAARLAGWLFAKVIGTRPDRSNVHFHHHWLSTQCAGPYMDSVYGQLLSEVRKAYDYFRGATTPPRPHQTGAAPKKSQTQIAAEVWAGKWGSGQDRINRLNAAGYDGNAIQALVNRGVGRASASAANKVPTRKTTTEIAKEVIAGKWGNGEDRKTRLAKAGYNATTVQNEVNRIKGVSSKKSIAQMADEVIAGKWGSGVDRKNRITKAGYSYAVIQAEVNRKLR